MGLHLIAYDSAVYNVSAFTQVNALTSEFETISNNGVIIDQEPLIIGAKYYSAHGARAQLRAPSIQVPDYPTLTAVMNAAASSSVTDRWDDWRDAPVTVKQGESLLGYVIDGNSTTEQDYLLVLLADKVPAPVKTPGRWVRLTGTTTLTADAWTSCPMTFDDQLPFGQYDILGARYVGASPVVGRLSLPGLGSRPPIWSSTSLLTPSPELFRIGQLGVLASFRSTAQLTLESLATAGDTAETLWLYVVGPK